MSDVGVKRKIEHIYYTKWFASMCYTVFCYSRRGKTEHACMFSFLSVLQCDCLFAYYVCVYVCVSSLGAPENFLDVTDVLEINIRDSIVYGL